MKKIIFFIITILCISCSKEEVEKTNSTITVLSSEKVRIGDTIVLSGQNMDKIKQLKFSNRFQNINVYPIENSNELIKVIVPKLEDENFNLYMTPNQGGYNSLHFNLVGTFPLPQTNGFSFDDLENIQMIDENIAFISANNKIYKTINGGYNWTTVKVFDSNIAGMYFLNENLGWVSFWDNSGFISKLNLYFTNDRGSTFDNIFTINEYYGTTITKIYFSSQNNGYILTAKGEVYETNDNSNFDLTYDFPYSNESSNFPEFYNLSVYNNNLIACGVQASQYGFIRKNNNNYDYVSSSNAIIKVQLIDELQAYLIMYTNEFGENLFFTNNIDSNLQETSNKIIHNFHFVNKNKGIGVSSNTNFNYHIIYETYDGGENWVNQFKFKDFEYCLDIDFYNNVGLISGYRGKLWKHIFE